MRIPADRRTSLRATAPRASIGSCAFPRSWYGVHIRLSIDRANRYYTPFLLVLLPEVPTTPCSCRPDHRQSLDPYTHPIRAPFAFKTLFDRRRPPEQLPYLRPRFSGTFLPHQDFLSLPSYPGNDRTLRWSLAQITRAPPPVGPSE